MTIVDNRAFLVAHSKESTFTAGRLGLIPGLGRSPGGGHGNPPQYCCLDNPLDRVTWKAGSSWGHRVRHDRANKHNTWLITLYYIIEIC